MTNTTTTTTSVTNRKKGAYQVRTTPFLFQTPDKECDANALLDAEACSNARWCYERDKSITQTDTPNAPKGCSRRKGEWYFNVHATGALDGESEPVCNPSKTANIEENAGCTVTRTVGDD